MPINEYDDMIKSGSVGDNNNPYFALVKEESEKKQTVLKTSMYTASKTDPDRQAKVMELSNKAKLPPDFVERNFDSINRVHSSDVDYDTLIKDYPGTAKWMEDPNNASVSQDDIADLSFFEGIKKSFERGYLQLKIASLSQKQRQAGLESRIHEGEIVKMEDRLNTLPNSTGVLRNVTEQLPNMAYGMYKGLKYGLPAGAAAAGTVAVAGQVPPLTLLPDEFLTVPGAFGFAAWKVGFPLGSFQAAKMIEGEAAYREFVNEKDYKGNNVSREVAAKYADMVGNINGTLEAASDVILSNLIAKPVAKLGGGLMGKILEKVPGSAPLLNVISSNPKVFEKMTFGQALRTAAKTLMKAELSEVSTEFAQEVTTGIIGREVALETGGAPPDAEDILNRAKGVIVPTAQATLGFGLLGGGSQVYNDFGAMNRAEHAKNMYLAMGQSAEASKLRERLPSAHRKFVEGVIKDSPVENIYISPDKFEEYFQSKKIDPAKVAQELGVDNNLIESRETGADIKIPLAAWSEKVVGTEHYQGLANDIKFAPDEMSINQTKQLHEEMKAQDEKALAESPTSEQGALQVSKLIEEQLKQAGRPPAEAKIDAQLYESRLRTRATLRGEDPLELFKREGLQINSPTENVPQGTMGAKEFNQPAYHGSPHIFDKFSLQKIGTGEGNQAYGYGLYFAGNKEVAKFYKENLSGGNKEISYGDEKITKRELHQKKLSNMRDYHTQALLDIANFDGLEGALQYNKEALENTLRGSKSKDYIEKYENIIAALNALDPKKINITQTKGRLYKVDIPEDSAYVDWDGLLADQPKLEKLSKKLKLGIDPYATTGENFYEALVMEFENEAMDAQGMSPSEAASKYLAAQGIAGIKYLDQGSRGVAAPQYGVEVHQGKEFVTSQTFDTKSAADNYINAMEEKGYSTTLKNFPNPEKSSNYVVFDDKLVKILEFEQRQGEEEARGRILFGEGKASIELLKNADQSTFLHETGHLWLNEVGQDLAHIQGIDEAKQTPQQKQFIKDAKTTLEWLGADSFENLTRDQHEQWARGFEAYLMEGKAPTNALRRAFANFKVWLVNIYRQARSLDVQLSDEVRGVMDRLLATEDEINAAQAQQNMTPLYGDPKAMGMSDAKAADYLEAIADSQQFAHQTMESRLLKEHARAQESWYKERTAEVKKEVEAEVSQQRVYKNIEQLREGADTNGTPFKLGREGIDAEMIKRLPRGILAPRGTTGLNVNIVAEMLSYESADQFLTTLANAPKKDELVNRMTDERMQQLYPDSMLNGTLPEEAMKAVHNEKRSQVLRLELEHLMSNDMPVYKDAVRRIVRRVPTQEAVRKTAREIVGGRTIKEIRPYLYQLAEARSAKEAGVALAKGDLNAAFEAKQRELLNHELYRSATLAQETVDDALQLYKKLAKSDEKLAKSRDVDLVNAARAILSHVGIGRTEKTAKDYIEPIRQYDPDTYNAVVALINSATENLSAFVPGDYQTLKYDDFVALKDTVEALWNLARGQEQILIDNEKRELSEVRAELMAGIQELTKPGNRLGYAHAVTPFEKIELTFSDYRSWLTRVESWAYAMDKGNPNGIFTKYIWNPISEAATQYRVEQAKFLERYLNQIVKPIEKTFVRGTIDSPELGYVFGKNGNNGKAELLGALLHSGNESNLSKLLRGRGWGMVDEEGILDTSRWDTFIKRMIDEGVLTKTDYDFAQNVWNLFEEMKPVAQKAHKEMYGYYFSEITANEFTTPFGTYKGGYVPAKVDPTVSVAQAIKKEREELLNNNNSFSFPTTGRGSAMKRVDQFAGPLTLDLRYVTSHIDWVMRFSYIEPRIKEVTRIVTNTEFGNTLEALDPTILKTTLLPWLQRSAQQKVQIPSKNHHVDDFFRGFRTRTGMQAMTANVTNALQQPAGLFVTAADFKPNELKHLRNALWHYTKNSKDMARIAAEKDPYMATRTTTQMMEIRQTIEDILLNPNNYEKAAEYAKKHGYFLQQHTQNLVDTISWWAGYNRAIARGATELEAVREARSVVRRTQGSFNAEDISGVESGTALTRFFFQFVGYFNMLANFQGSQYLATVRSLGLKKGMGRMLYVYCLGFMTTAIISEAIMRAMSGRGLDADDDDQYLDDVMDIFFGSQFRTATAMLPIVNQVANVMVNAFNDKWYDDRITVSPSITMLESSAHAPFEIYKAFVEDAKAAPAIRDTLTLLGLATGLPLAPLAKPINYLTDVSSGEAQPTGPIDFARGLVTGKSGN